MNYNIRSVKLECFLSLCIPISLAFKTVSTRGRHSITSYWRIHDNHACVFGLWWLSPAKRLYVFWWRSQEKKAQPQLPLDWIQKWFQWTWGRAERLVLVQRLLRCRGKVASVFLTHCSIPGEQVTPRLCRSFQYLGLNELWNICFISAWVHFWGLKLYPFWAERGARTVFSEHTRTSSIVLGVCLHEPFPFLL